MSIDTDKSSVLTYENSNAISEDEKDVNSSAVTQVLIDDKVKRNNFIGNVYRGFKKNINPVTAVLLAVIIALSVCVVAVGNSVSKLSDDIKLLSDTKGVYSEKTTPAVVLSGKTDRIYTYNLAYGDVAIPAIEGLPVSNYKEENFRTDNKGFKYYYDGEELSSYVGVDVSAFNGDIDWQKVKEAGVEFAMLRIGGRGWGADGEIYKDSYFERNLIGAREAGLKVGAYFFSQAISREEALEEAQFALDCLGGAELDYPLAFDWEIVSGESNARTNNISPDTLTECARAFCDRIKEEGYIPCLYTGAALAYYKYDLAQLSDVDIWYAFYNDAPGFYYNYMMWQYSDKGRVDGISSDVDLNICFKNYK